MITKNEQSECEFQDFPDTGMIIFNKDLNILLSRDHDNVISKLISGKKAVQNLSEIHDFNLRRKTLAITKAVLSGSDAKEDLVKGDYKVIISAFPLKDDQGVIQNGIIFIRRQSLSNQKMESDLKRDMEYAEKKNKLKSDFIASLSHEIRTPLNAIIGFTEQLKKTSLDEKQKDFLQIIDNSSFHLLDLVNEILTFSKLESGEVQLDEIDFKLESLVDDVYKTFRERAKNKKINFRYHFDNKLKRIFRGDAIRLKQILINLVNNAIKFTESGFVELSITYLEKKENSTWIEFGVTDSGIGIPENKLNEIFLEFRQADGGIARKYVGSGLGLTISKRLTELMNGKLSVTSTEGKGSVFTVKLPLMKSNAKSIEDDNITVNSEVLSGKPVLVVDDDAMNRLLGKIILEDFNMEVDIAKDGEDALKLIGEKHYEIILLDIHMPGISGIDLAGKIRTDLQNMDVKIIAVTAAVIKDDLEEYFRHGINDYLIKPYREFNLYNKICKVLDIKSRQVKLDKTEIILQELKVMPLYNLYELRKITRGKDSHFREMVETFIKNSTDGLKGIKSAYENKNWKLVGEIAHRLLPSYKHIDIKTAASDLVELKRRSFDNPEPDKIRILISQIEETTSEVIELLKKEKP